MKSQGICLIFFLILNSFFFTACTNKSSTRSANSSQAVLQDILGGLSDQEKSELASKLGLTLEELKEKISKFSFTLKELSVLASLVDSENALSVKLSFTSNQSTYTPVVENESNLPCLHYDPKTGFPGKDYIVDTVKPNFSELPIVNIIPDELNRPKDYVFSAKCTAPLSVEQWASLVLMT